MPGIGLLEPRPLSWNARPTPRAAARIYAGLGKLWRGLTAR
jgi:hypothetical protein